MTLFALSGLLNGFSSLLFGFFVFSRDRKNKSYQLWLAFSLAVSLWEFSAYKIGVTTNKEEAFFWWRVAHIGVILIPVFFAQFIYTWLQIKKGFFFYFLYFFGGLFTLLNLFDLLIKPTGLFIANMRWVFNSFYYDSPPGLLYVFFAPLWLFIILYAHYELIKIYKNAISQKKLQIQYFFFAFVVAYAGGATCFLPVFGIDFYPYFNFTLPFYPLIMSYAIIMHHLLDIKMVMRRSSVYLATLTSIVVPAFFIEYAFSAIFKGYSIWSEVFILTVAISIFPPIKNYYYRFANKYLFSSLYDSKEVIAELSDKLRTTLEVDKIHALISEILTSSFHSKSIGVLFFNKKRKNYTLRHNSGFNIGKLKTIKNNQEIYDLYISANKIIVLEELKNYSYDRYKEYIDELAGYNMEVLVPLNVKDKNLGILVLGPKEAGDMYNDEDLGVLKIVSAQMAIALENALLYEETKSFNKKLKQEIEIATTDLLSANEKLKKLDVAKSEFISIASHQLRTPLTAIKGYISMMIEGDFGELTKVEQEALEKVFNSNERLIKLVENLLNVSRIESGRLQFNFEEVQLETMVESVMDELSNYAKKKDLTLEYKKPETPLPKVNIDDEKIRQVVMNLIDNAIKYTKQGTVTVSLAQVENNLEFRVSDSGMGISPTDLPNLFQKFSRGTGASLTHTEGTGLGLYVARQMIEAHQGKIWAESKGEAMGSRFCFKLPISIQNKV